MKVEMPSLNIKDILAKLSVLKSNFALLVSIIIALVAILLFIPEKLLSSGLKKSVTTTSVSQGNKVKQGLRNAVPRDQWKEYSKLETAYANDANEIARLSLESTQRELLSYDIFPARKDESAMIFKAFGERYQAGIEAMLARLNANDCPTDAEFSQGVTSASGNPAVGGGYSRPSRSPYSSPSRSPYSSPSRSPYSGLSRSPYSRPGASPYSRSPRVPYPYPGSGYGVSGATGGVESTIRDEICLDRAKSSNVYANRINLAGYEFWGEYQYDVKPEDAIQDCWYYQLGYWMIEDVFSTIESMNSGSANVLTAPVKRLLEVSFGGGTTTGGTYSSRSPYGGSRSPYGGSRSPYGGARSPYGGGRSFRQSGGGQAGAARPGYVTDEQPGLVQDVCTGRLSNDEIDVMHFKVSVVVAVKSVLPFMKELCSIKRHRFKGFFNELPQTEQFAHNQITILESDFVAVDRMDGFHELYRYGQDAVVELNLVCEYVFNKEAYDPIVPKEVRGDEPEADAQQTMTSGYPMR